MLTRQQPPRLPRQNINKDLRNLRSPDGKRVWAPEMCRQADEPARLTLILLERSHRCGFVVPYVEYRIQFGDLEQVMDFLGEIEQLQLAALVPD